MSVPTFPDATAQEKFMLMLLERVDGLTEELHTVKKELADARAQQVVAPLPSVTIEHCRVHSSRWYMRVFTSTDTPLATEVFARRVSKILPGACLYIQSYRIDTGGNVLKAYIDAGVYVNLAVTVNAIHDAVYADHTPFSCDNQGFHGRIDKYTNDHFGDRMRCVDVICLQVPNARHLHDIEEFIRQPDVCSFCLERPISGFM
jgi:hypothetical protein